LRDWVKMVQFYVHKPTILVVGTHLDLLPKKSQKEACKKFREDVATQLAGQAAMIKGMEIALTEVDEECDLWICFRVMPIFFLSETMFY
jgi:hypothetical protein